MSHARILGGLVLAAFAGGTLALLAALGYASTPTAAAQYQYAPRNTSPPSISGSATVGGTLRAATGQWAGADRITFQWQRCDAAGAGCSDIPGAQGETYAVSATDVGRRIRVVVIASNANGSGTAVSGASAVVQVPGPSGVVLLPGGGRSVPISSVGLPQRLVIDRVTFAPTRIRSRNEPITVRVHVVDTRGFAVRDALVFLRSTPLVTTTPPERRTATDGWATLQTFPQRDFALVFRSGYSVQFFVRARKAGENPLAGVSTRRLVQVSVSPRR